jgi:hypothetical protein
MANPNVFNGTTLYGNVAGLAVGTSYANAVQNPASSGSLYKVKSLIVTNACNATLSVTLQLNQAGTNTNISANVGIPSAASVVLLAKDTEVYLLENNSLQINASAAGYITAVTSWDQIS